jgi:hypothetical protein
MAVDGVNVRVIGTEVLAASRSFEAMFNTIDLTCVNATTEDDGSVSEDVCTLTFTTPAVAAPIVNPVNVIAKFCNAPMAAPDVVIAIDVAVVAPHVAARPTTLLLPINGVTDEAKKPDG